MKKNNKKNTPVIVAVIIAAIILVAIVVYFVMRKPVKHDTGTAESSELDAHLNGGWIDCMPPLDDFETRLCERAKEINYPYIAY